MVREYIIKLDSYNLIFNKFVRGVVFKGFLGINFSAYKIGTDNETDCATYFTLFGFMNSTDPEPKRNIFLNNEIYELKLSDYINNSLIENNLFGYELKEIKIYIYLIVQNME